jgi:6-phosphogluconolactonase (cycloisomerase 2 family)
VRIGRKSALLSALASLALAAPASADELLFSSNAGSLGGIESVTPFTVNGDGSLVPGAPVPVGDEPEGLAITPDARFLYVPTLAPEVRGYAIGAKGSLTEVPGSPFDPKGIGTTAAAVTPAGDRLLVTNRGTGLNEAADPGSIAVYDINPVSGALSAVAGSPFAVAGLEGPSRLAISPDGARVFVSGDAAGSTFDPRVAVLNINKSTGALTQVGGSPFASGSKQAVPVVVSPDGKLVFVGNVHGTLGNTISVLSVNQATGALAAVSGSPFATAGTIPIGLGLAPDGSRLFSGERGPTSTLTARGVSVYNVSAAGALATVAGSPFPSGEREVRGTVVSGNGNWVYGMASADPGVVLGFSIEGGGALASLPGSPYPTGDQFSDAAPIAMTPIQSPKPQFGPTQTEIGATTNFDASATTVLGGEATRYDWDFGDGIILTNGGPKPSHRYFDRGSYTVTLSVTNDCDPNAVFTGGVVFTGQTAHCNGPRRASVSKTIAIVDSIAPEVTGVGIAGRFRAGSKPTATSLATATQSKVKTGAKVRYSLSEGGRVTIAFEKRKRGAKKGKRFKSVGSIVRQGLAGPNAVRFSGRIGKKRPLAPGRYRVVVTATDAAGNKSAPKNKAFKIVR